jgi:hypothetical protein
LPVRKKIAAKAAPAGQTMTGAVEKTVNECLKG